MDKNFDQQRDILFALCRDYIIVYHIDLDKDLYSILRMDKKVDHAVADMVEGQKCFSQTITNYIDTFVKEEEREYLHRVTGREYILERFENADNFDVRYTTQSHNGKQIYFEMHFVNVSENSEEHTLVLAWRCVDEVMKREFTHQQELKDALNNANAMFQEIIEMQSSGIIAIRAETKEIIIMNAAALQMYEWKALTDFEGNLLEVINRSNIPNEQKVLSRLFSMNLGDHFSFEYSIARRDGSKLGILSQSRMIVLKGGEKLILSTLTDITYKFKREQKLFKMSSMDKLTKICNRACGERQVEHLLQEGRPGMFCLLDVDDFKSINDNYGHMVGDDALIAVAESMKQSFRDQDIIMRLGGDEFVVFVADITEEAACSRMLKRFMDSIREIRVGEDSEVCLSLSLGAVLCSGSEALSFDELYQKADSAMYRCKRRKKKNKKIKSRRE